MKRYGPVGSKWNSRKYLRMHNESISRGLKAYYERKKKIQVERSYYVFILIVMAIYFIIKFWR